ncbi:MAG: hypothetical protein WCC57_12775 [Paracoccaceae bacterium]
MPMLFSKHITLGLVAFSLVACTSRVPDSGAGVGFENYSTYLQQREAALANGTSMPSAPAATQAATEFSTQRLGAAIDAADGGTSAGVPLSAAPANGLPMVGAEIGGNVGESDRPRGDAPAGIAPQSGEVAPGSVGISDEQEFSAVAARETIASDKERIARNRAAYQVVQPTELPQRSGDTGPNIVQFALSTSHAVGTQMYKRSSLRLGNANAACNRFSSPDQAQEAFLASGGPEKDRKGLDADGDGFACSWDPTPFRAALN